MKPSEQVQVDLLHGLVPSNNEPGNVITYVVGPILFPFRLFSNGFISSLWFVFVLNFSWARMLWTSVGQCNYDASGYHGTCDGFASTLQFVNFQSFLFMYLDMYFTNHNETLLDHRIWCNNIPIGLDDYEWHSFPSMRLTFFINTSISSSTHTNIIYSWYTSHILHCGIIIMTWHIPRIYELQHVRLISMQVTGLSRHYTIETIGYLWMN